MENLLWVANSASPDIKTAISFLCNRVSKNDQSNKNKLKRILKSLSCAIDEVRVIGADNLIHIHTHIYVTHTTTPYMCIYTGGYTFFGWGMVHFKSSKQILLAIVPSDHI